MHELTHLFLVMKVCYVKVVFVVTVVPFTLMERSMELACCLFSYLPGHDMARRDHVSIEEKGVIFMPVCRWCWLAILFIAKSMARST